MKKLLGFFLFFITANIGFAVLPPYYQSVKEIQELLSDQRLAEKIGSGQMILSITRTEKGYVIVTPQKKLKIDVHYSPPKYGMGPSQYEFHFHEPKHIKCEK